MHLPETADLGVFSPKREVDVGIVEKQCADFLIPFDGQVLFTEASVDGSGPQHLSPVSCEVSV